MSGEFDDGTLDRPGSNPISNKLLGPIVAEPDPGLRRRAAERQRAHETEARDPVRATLDVGPGVPGLVAARRALDETSPGRV